MMIDKNNYEAYVLDYLEGTISEQDKQWLLLFFEEHPELKADLEADIHLSIQPAETDPIFELKDELRKHEAEAFDMPVKDYLLIKKAEEGLSESQESELILAEPDQTERTKAESFFRQMRLKPEMHINFNEKSQLRRFIFLPAFRQVFARRGVAAVAAGIAILFGVWMTNNAPETEQPELASGHEIQTPIVSKPAIAQNKILEKPLLNEAKPSKDSLLKLSSNPMMETPAPADTSHKPNNRQVEHAQYLAGLNQIALDHETCINAFEHGLNVMMPQYMNNNLLSAELASIYQQIEQEGETSSLSLALVESGVKVMNFLSKEPVEMNKYYNADGKVVGYKLKGDNLEINHRVK